MSGYAKRMMESAAPWMDANPEPFSGRITVPRVRLPRLTVPLEIEQAALARERTSSPIRALAADKDKAWSTIMSTVKSDEDMDRLERALVRNIERSRSLITEHDQVADGLERDYLKLEEILNRTRAKPMPLEDLFGLVLGGWFLSWGHDGYNVFDLSPDFVAAMLLTDPSTLIGEREFRLPFRGLLVFLPDGFARDGGGSFTKLHVSTLRGDDEIGGILEIVAVSGTRAVSTAAALEDISVDGLAAFEDGRDCGDADRTAMETVRRIVLGTVGYLAMMPDARTERDTQRRRDNQTKAAPKFWDVGRDVRLDPNLVRAARAGSREVALRVARRHIVRGHYRNQPIGAGRKERKTIWIAPFWKGPSDGAAIIHTYKPST
ncbi:MAG TPA: hypothetical protein VFO62_10550 [Candidatus Binatia bacterium]|nr:hypothetical protein [Candidatus Binatia bacterium]